MNLIDRREMIAAKMILAVLFCSGVYQTAAAYQVNVYTTGNDLVAGAATDLRHFDGSGPQETRWDIIDNNSGRSIATNNSTFFVAEDTGAINRYDRQGNFLHEYADVSENAGKTPNAQKIESDVTGNIYLCFGGFHSTARKSCRLDPAGTISATFSHLDLVFAGGIDANANGDVFILESSHCKGGGRLFKFDASGNYLDDFALADVKNAMDIAISESTNELFIADVKTNAVLIYDLGNGTPVLTHTLPVPGRVLDVFVEQTMGRIFGTSVNIGLNTQGLSVNAEGFEVSRDGRIITTLKEANSPRSQTVYGIVAIAVF